MLSPGVTPVKSPTRKRVAWSEALPKQGQGGVLQNPLQSSGAAGVSAGRQLTQIGL